MTGTVKELLTSYAKKGYSRAMVRRELGWSRYQLDGFCREYPDIPWWPFWETIEYRNSLRDRDRSKTTSPGHLMKMWKASYELQNKYEVLGMKGTTRDLHTKLTEMKLCTVSLSTVRRRIRHNVDLEQAFLMGSCHRCGPKGWLKNKV